MCLNTIICASGELGFSSIQSLSEKINILGILTDFSSKKIINWANDKGIPLFIGNPRKKKFATSIRELGEVDILLSINYLFIIEKDLIEIPRILPVNIHGSLLPKYRGRAPHIWAIINGEKSVGITIHKIEEGCDTGDILLQKEIELTDSTTGGDVLKIYSAEYPIMLSKALNMIETKSYQLKKQNHEEATFFGKRTPDDGEICWRWESKKILNWVRALTAPYPGAFTFLNGHKIYIWAVEETKINLRGYEADGAILKVLNGELLVKVPDKALKITRYSLDGNCNIKEGDVFEGKNE